MTGKTADLKALHDLEGITVLEIRRFYTVLERVFDLAMEVKTTIEAPQPHQSTQLVALERLVDMLNDQLTLHNYWADLMEIRDEHGIDLVVL